MKYLTRKSNARGAVKETLHINIGTFEEAKAIAEKEGAQWVEEILAYRNWGIQSVKVWKNPNA